MIESLQSTHVARVKALLSSKKERYESGEFVAEGLQPVREAIAARAIETIYLTTNGAERLAENSKIEREARVIIWDRNRSVLTEGIITTEGVAKSYRVVEGAKSPISVTYYLYLSIL